MSTPDHSVHHTQTDPNAGSDSRSGPHGNGAVVRNGLVGGAVGLLLSFVPLSTVLGGTVAGYLAADRGRHAATGTVAGVVAFVPYLLAGLHVLTTPAAALPVPVAALSPGIVVTLVGVALVYAVGLSVLGSILGRRLYRESRG